MLGITASSMAGDGGAISNRASPNLLRRIGDIVGDSFGDVDGAMSRRSTTDRGAAESRAAKATERARKTPTQAAKPKSVPGSRSVAKPKTAAKALENKIDLGDPRLQIELRRSAGARRLSLSVSHIDGRARLTVPDRCPQSAAKAFLVEHRDWLIGAMARAPSLVTIAPDVEVPYLGAPHLIEAARGKSVQRCGRRLEVGGPVEQIGRRVVAWLREEARSRLLERSRAHAQAINANFVKIAIRDTRSRWGSCSSSGTLSYCWRLIMAPYEVLDYVAAHEVAHLAEMNHSPRFWAVVEKLRPDWRDQRDWLRLHGADLHRYRAE